MERQPLAELVEQLVIEVTAQRLIIRSIIGHLLVSDDKPIITSIKTLEDALEKMSPDVLPIPDLDPELHRTASVLARKRADDLLRNIGALVEPPRPRAPADPDGHTENKRAG